MKTNAYFGKRHVLGTAAVVAVAWGILALTPRPAVSAWQVGTPIVTYYNAGPETALTVAKAQQAVDGGFNLVWINNVSQLAIAEQYGLRAQLNMSQFWNPANLDDPAALAQMNAAIDQFKTSPAAYSYIIGSEPVAADFPGLGRMADYIRQRDPDHLAYIPLFPTFVVGQYGPWDSTVTAYNAYLNQYVGTVNPSLLSYDHYQLLTSGDERQYFGNMALVSSAARNAGVPFMPIVQGCAWDLGWRIPTANELRFLDYTALAYGAQGISYFNYFTQYPNTGGIRPNGDGTPTSVFTALTPLNREFVAVAKQLQPLHSVGAYHLGDQPPGTLRLTDNSLLTPTVTNTTYVDGQPVKGIVVGFFGPDNQLADATRALVVNLDYQNSRTTTVNGSADLSVFDTTTGTWVPQHSHQATLNLPPGGGVLVALPGHTSVTVPKGSSQFPFKYEMNVLPTADNQGGAAGPDWFIAAHGGESGGPPSVSGGIMTLSLATQGDFVFENTDTATINFNTGYTIEFRAKVVSSPSTWNFSVIAPPGLPHNDQIPFLHIGASRTNWGDGGAVSYDIDRNSNSDGFHVFRIVQEPGTNGIGAIYHVWRDGVLLSRSDGSGLPLTTAFNLSGQDIRAIAFGDHGGEWLGTTQFDYFRFDTTGAFAPVVFLPGDVNFDGVVDIFDINLVSSHWGETGSVAEANGDGVVNIFDINLISANWSPSGGSAVPEPGTIVLLGLAAIPLLGRGRRGK